MSASEGKFNECLNQLKQKDKGKREDNHLTAIRNWAIEETGIGWKVVRRCERAAR